MKKLIIAMAIVAVATFAQASSCMWKLSTGTTYENMNVYALTGTSSATVLAACLSSDAADWTNTFADVTPAKSTTGTRGAAAGTVQGVVAGDTITFVITDGAIAEGTKFWVVNDVTVSNLFDPPSTGKAVTFSPSSLAGSGTFQSIPEPTSGLLMLLGMAGLALKRKQA